MNAIIGDFCATLYYTFIIGAYFNILIRMSELFSVYLENQSYLGRRLNQFAANLKSLDRSPFSIYHFRLHDNGLGQWQKMLQNVTGPLAVWYRSNVTWNHW